MSINVKETEITRLNKLYHKLLMSNASKKLQYPKELSSLSTIDISVVNLVAENKDIIVREIAAILSVPNSTLTSSINRLEKKNLVRRLISMRDRRSFSLELTEQGWEIQQLHLAFERSYFEAILEKLDTYEEREIFMDLIDKIVTGFVTPIES